MAPSTSDPALKKMLKLVNWLMNRSDAGPFREPVDWRGLELYDYPKIIKKMMDLGTVKRKLERKQYRNHLECANDIRLIWSNCKIYNMEGSDFHLLANSYSRRFEEKYKKIRFEFGEPEEEESDADEEEEEAMFDDEPMDQKPAARRRSSPVNDNGPTGETLDAKARFSSGIFLLSGIELGHVISTIELNCPEALEHIHNAPEHIEINVDAMKESTFAELDKYVQEKVGGNERMRKMAAGTEPRASSRDRKKRKR